jgi:hypothetical protein
LINKRDYELIGILDDEEDVLDSLSGYSSSYVCDAINELADNNVPIYYNDIWEHARDSKDYVENAQKEGLCEGVTDVEKLFQIGYYMYYQQSLYNNLDVIAFNEVAEKVNVYLEELEEETLNNLDIVTIEEEIENQTSDFDNNEYISKWDDISNDIITEIKDGTYKNEEDEEEE